MQYFNVYILLSGILVLEYFVNPFQLTFTLLYPLKTSENHSEILRGWGRNATLA